MKDKKQGTVSRLRAAFIAAAVLVSAFSGATYAQELQAPSAGITQTAHVCQLDIKELTRQLVERDFPGESAISFVRAYNDIRCEVPEDMANVVAVVKRAEGETLFGIFHIHSRHKANILTTAVSFNDDMRDGHRLPRQQAGRHRGVISSKMFMGKATRSSYVGDPGRML